jgi:tRNA modification GTPase
LDTADALLILLDGSREVRAEDRILLEQTAGRPRVIVVHKCDCPASWPPEAVFAEPAPWCKVSSRTGEGLEELLDRLRSVLGASIRPADTAGITNVRHIALLERCAASLTRAMNESVRLGERAPEELLLFELGDARSALVEVVGLHPQDEVLTYVFDRFCIGK